MNILITGASSGIGAELASRFSCPGNNLILTGRNEDRLYKVWHQGQPFEVGEYGWNSCHTVAGDLADFHTSLRINEILRDEFDGKLDLLILAAGVYDKWNLFSERTEDDEDKIPQKVLDGTLSGNLLYV